MIRHRRPAYTTKPLARSEGLSVTTSGDETLVYDRKKYVIHRLGPEIAAVWRLADGTRDLAVLSEASGCKNIKETLRGLVSIGLIEGEQPCEPSLTRRRVLAGVAGASAAATYIAPVAASGCSPVGAWGGPCKILNVPEGQDDMGTMQCVRHPNGTIMWWCIGADWDDPWEPVKRFLGI